MTDQERIEEIENHVKRGYHLIVNSTDDMKFLLQQLAARDERIEELRDLLAEIFRETESYLHLTEGYKDWPADSVMG
ncbi:hypothetical protein LCGC14_0729420, partial [marine sediment metagenome]